MQALEAVDLFQRFTRCQSLHPSCKLDFETEKNQIQHFELVNRHRQTEFGGQRYYGMHRHSSVEQKPTGDPDLQIVIQIIQMSLVT